MKNNYDFDEREIGATYLSVDAKTLIQVGIKAEKYEFIAQIFGAIILILIGGIGFGATIMLSQPKELTPTPVVQPL